MPSKTVPTCRSCGAAHYNFQGCGAAIGKTEKPGPPVEYRPREGEHDWHSLGQNGVLGFGATLEGFGTVTPLPRKAPDGSQKAA